MVGINEARTLHNIWHFSPRVGHYGVIDFFIINYGFLKIVEKVFQANQSE